MNQKEVWNTIADSWRNLRVNPEREAVEFAGNSKELILDVGCGHGRNLVPFLQKKMKCVGVDFSKSMIREAKKFLTKRNLHAHLAIGDVTKLPFKDKEFANAIYIRTLSTVETKEGRLKSLQEVRRTADRALITAWKKWHWSFWKGWRLKYFLNLIRHGFSSDLCVDWNYHGKKYKRFYHNYTKNEFESELKALGFKIEKMWENEEGNICAVVS